MTKEQATRKALELALTHLTNPMALQMSRDQIVSHIKEALQSAARVSNEQVEPVKKYCCHLCFNKSGQLFLDRMILCPDCGNKRCPKATHHELQCTNSNEPNQAGSVYTHPPVPTAQQEQEPDRGVYWKCVRCGYAHIEDECPQCGFHTRAEFNFPPQRKPLLASDIVTMYEENPRCDADMVEFARAIEAAHGIKP